MANRIWHYLKKNDKTETIQNCIFVDTETAQVPLDSGGVTHVLKYGYGFFYRRGKRGKWNLRSQFRFDESLDFWQWVQSNTRPRSTVWVWCHNSSFDYPVLDSFRILTNAGFRVESAIIDSPPTVIKWRRGSVNVILCDTLNLWRMSLRELGQYVGLPKYREHPDSHTLYYDSLYCRRDVEIIARAVTEWTDFLVREDLGGFCPTIASQSMRTFRHKYMKDPILIDNDRQALSTARACYHGGRVECGYIGKQTGEFVMLDVNSMYPYVMKTGQFPVSLVRTYDRLGTKELTEILSEFCVCLLGEFDISRPFLGIPINGKLIFPTGKFHAYACTPEVEYALKRGELRRVGKVAVYKKASAFTEFVTDLHGKRVAAIESGKLMEVRHWKLLLNSFYGKWGQNGRKDILVGRCDPSIFRSEVCIDSVTGRHFMRRYFGGIVSETGEDGESFESHPAIAAHVTAQARMVLWALIEKVPPEDYLYSDTDGILIRATALDLFRDALGNKELGKLKQVGTYREVVINGCKDYSLDGKVTLKGVRPTALQINDGVYRQDKWSSLKGLLRKGDLSSPFTVPITKTLLRHYDKGVTLDSGIVRPFHLPDDAGLLGWDGMSALNS